MDRTALVTGGGTGVGRAVAVALARDGFRVAIAGRREEKLRETAALAESILFRVADVAEAEAARALVEWATAQLGSIGVLVQCAGINIRRRAIAELDVADWDRVMQVNASSAFYCIAAVLPGMRQRGDGLIVNISSVAGKRASPLGGAAYSASKFAMTALGTCVGLEEGRNGIRVTNVYPGEIDTPILDARPVPVTAEHRAAILQPEDVAAVVLMLAHLDRRAHVPELVIKPTIQSYA
jgi:NAD(P)-dependent dehydrogenase (short-subunit alcohol dehydrogenase family)